MTWAGYGTLVGVGAGLWLADHPTLAVVAGVVIGTLAGFGIDWVLRRWTGMREVPLARAEEPEPPPAARPVPAVVLPTAPVPAAAAPAGPRCDPAD